MFTAANLQPAAYSLHVPTKKSTIGVCPQLYSFLSEVFFEDQAYTLCGERGFGEVFIVTLVVALDAYTLTGQKEVLNLKITDEI